jgi:predicted nucleic acid-binding protein
MIHLDANVLIRLSVPGSAAAHKVRAWLLAGEAFSVSAPAWFEYISGPLTSAELIQAEALVQGRIVDFGKSTGHRAADLFNLTGRKRSTKLDCMIAATAILANARLATSNVGDFQSFVAHGLRLDAV